jgi:hypothetical protein
MLNVQASDVVESPFPHVVSDAILPPDLYRRLKADWPQGADFESTAASTGGVGSRAGRSTGFDIYRGDPAYDRLVAESPAWAEFDAWINSPAFIAKYHELFGPYAEAMGLCVDIERSTYVRDYIEPRAVLTAHETLGDKLAGFTHRLTRGLKEAAPAELFTRLDMTRSLGGYAKAPHCDRPNRLCSLIIYFTNAEEVGLEGGDLMLYRGKQPQPIEKAPRHPRPDEVDVVATLKPQENRGVFFPCCNTSYHGVTAVASSGVPRDFLYINISGRMSNLW